MTSLGEKIRSLRKQKNISQEILANYLGVSFQSVSKWENGTTMPDVMLIPAIASFFRVSTDELFDFNVYETEMEVSKIVDEQWKYCSADKARAETIIREGLRKYPGNDVLLNCLIGVLPLPEKAREVTDTAKQLAECTRDEAVRLDALRIMAEAYAALGEYDHAKDAIERIPEIYFSKLCVKAFLLEGEEKYEAAVKEAGICFERLVSMLEILAEYYLSVGEEGKAKIMLEEERKVLMAFEADIDTPYTKSKYAPDKIRILEKRISQM